MLRDILNGIIDLAILAFAILGICSALAVWSW